MELKQWHIESFADVYAIEKITSETLTYGSAVYSKSIGERQFQQYQQLSAKLNENLLNIFSESGKLDEIQNSSQTFYKTLNDMRSLSLNGAWDNPIELAQWGGFLAGAQLIYWTRIDHVAKDLKDRKINNLSSVALKFYQKFLSEMQKLIQNYEEEKKPQNQ